MGCFNVRLLACAKASGSGSGPMTINSDWAPLEEFGGELPEAAAVGMDERDVIIAANEL